MLKTGVWAMSVNVSRPFFIFDMESIFTTVKILRQQDIEKAYSAVS